MMKRTLVPALLAFALFGAPLSFGDTERPHLRAARLAAKWIEGSAVRSPAGTAWPAVPPDRETIQANLYSGDAGTVLFFLELQAASGDKRFLDDALAGADRLLAVLPEEKDLGLYSGAAGLSFALEEVFKASGRTAYRDGFLRGVEMIRSRAVTAGAGVEWDNVTDIISGSSGLGLFLLYAASELDDASLTALAARAGRRLIELGRPEAGGVKWVMAPDFPRLMPNFSHGTAGVSYFLASLYERTKEKAFLDAALAGARYLTAVAKTDDDGCLIFHNEPDGRDLYYLGWCHGPAGTARLFERLFRITGDKTWRDWMSREARSLARSGIPEKRTPGFWNNVGMCCGSAGVADFLLDVSRATNDPAPLALVRRLTSDLLARATAEGEGLKWVQAEHRVRPDFLQAQTGLMQGAAGIGLWLLRLDGFEQGRKRTIVLPDDPFGN
jgi:lantibiotic modifying enzyme